MRKIDNKSKTDTRERITILSKKDLQISWFSGGPGAGGQYRNKHDNCCRMYHEESGARSQATEERSRERNLRKAFERLCKTPQMRFWFAKKVYEIRQRETLEQTVEKEIKPENLKYEVKNEEGRWVQVDDSYFETLKAKTEVEQ